MLNFVPTTKPYCGLPVAPKLLRVQLNPEFGKLLVFLCRGLCRNPAIPTGIGSCRWLSRGHRQTGVKTRGTRINAGFLYYSDFFSVAPSRTGFGFDTVEVCGSSPHGPTTLFNSLESFLGNPRETSPVFLHL